MSIICALSMLIVIINAYQCLLLIVIQGLSLGTIYTIFAYKRAIQISVRLKDVQVLKNLIIPFILSDYISEHIS